MTAEVLDGLVIAPPTADFADDLRLALTRWASTLDTPLLGDEAEELAEVVRITLICAGWPLEELSDGSVLAFPACDAKDLVEAAIAGVIDFGKNQGVTSI